MGDIDIREGMGASSSSRRYQALAQPATAIASQPVPVRQRASRSTVQEPITRVPRRTVEQPRSRRGGTPEPITRATGPKLRPLQAQPTQPYLDNEPNAQTTVPLDIESEQEYDVEMPAQTTTLLGDDPDAHTDIQVRMPVPYRRPQPQAHGKHQRKHALVFVGLGMGAMLALWLLAVQAMVGWTNTVSDPRYYTQTAHLDTVTISTDAQGHQSQVRAFIDAQGHLDMLVLPVSDSSKAHVVIGPTLSSISDPQKATITVTAKGTVITVTIQGPLQANFLATTRQRSVWSIDLQKGGH